ncbi:hypothetical protein RRF57_008421 [Xylaria bambusicola]|uniref:Uncharacterized protein n=1 Tax=Xylaria bambusicola TaxID=326684 RepID=A0AAN7Z8B4_9PEZI
MEGQAGFRGLGLVPAHVLSCTHEYAGPLPHPGNACLPQTLRLTAVHLMHASDTNSRFWMIIDNRLDCSSSWASLTRIYFFPWWPSHTYSNMTATDVLSENISLGRFNELLSRYDSLIASMSDEKPPKPGQSSLLTLDKYRYGEATDLFRSNKPKRQMVLDDVKALVDWKLRHGKFRPTLMKLVSSNEEEVVSNTIQETMAQYWLDDNVTKAMDAITKLKGIGPATASLLLSVHDPERVIFFSDEAFWWLCCSGQQSPIKYNAKEYQQLNIAADKLVKRLQVGATDIEKVAYVVMKDNAGKVPISMSPPPKKTPVKQDKRAEEAKPKPAAKRKNSSVIDIDTKPLRRSQRQKAS